MTVAGLDIDMAQIAEICQRFGVARLDVFGSVGRGEARIDSDVDLLYELAPGAQLGWDIENLADELSVAFGRPVDLVSRKALNRRLRTVVLAEAKPLYAA